MEKVKAGVIQGPVLFLLFIADINDSIPIGIELLKYADDILIYLSRRKYDDHTMQMAADGLVKWCQTNKMKLKVKNVKR